MTMRLDAYVAQYWPEQSRSSWQKLIKAGAVCVNGQPVVSSKHELSEDDHVTVTQPPSIDHSAETLPILFEDDNVIVIDKPAGILTHVKGPLSHEFSVAEFVRSRTSYQTDSNRPGIIHRLDRDTSGVIVCAKNPETARMLQKQFQDRTVKKTYLAVVQGVPKQLSARIDVPIGRDPNRPSQFRADPNGKSARTTYEVLEHDDSRSLIKLQPTTGRTHQLRVHMSYLNTPIVGDRVYGQAASRLLLHAQSLELTLPGGVRTVFRSHVPAEFAL